MNSLATLTAPLPLETLVPGEALMEEGGSSGRLYVLVEGTLGVERDGLQIATLTEPGVIIGEMAVLLGTPHSATVRALSHTSVRVIDEAIDFLSANPELALHVATLACARLNDTSALLVDLRRATAGRKDEQTLLGRIFATLSGTPSKPTGRSGWAAHE